MEKKAKKKFKMPGSYVLIFYILVVVWLLTFIIPAGTYENRVDPVTGEEELDPNSFHFVEGETVTPMDFLLSIPNGMTDNNTTIFLVILMGGSFGLILATGALDRALDSIIRKLGTNSIAVVPILGLLMWATGGFLAIGNAIVAFVPLGLLFARKLKLDPVVGVAMTFLISYAGFGTTPLNPSTVLTAQNLAGLPPMSGAGFRFVVMFIILGVTLVYITAYAKRVQKDPSKTILDKIEWDGELAVDEAKPCSITDYIILIMLAIGCVWFAYGSMNWDYTNYHLVAIIFLVAIISGIISRMPAEKIASEWVTGCGQLTSAGIIIGVATSISLVMQQGQIIHTIVYYVTIPLGYVGKGLSALLMYYVVTVFNFIITSGSGLAAVVVPLFAPMADVLGLSRQLIISSYQYGDGMSNIIVPTAASLVASIGMAKIPYGKWLKFCLPLFLLWFVITSAAIVVGGLIGF